MSNLEARFIIPGKEDLVGIFFMAITRCREEDHIPANFDMKCFKEKLITAIAGKDYTENILDFIREIKLIVHEEGLPEGHALVRFFLVTQVVENMVYLRLIKEGFSHNACTKWIEKINHTIEIVLKFQKEIPTA